MSQQMSDYLEDPAMTSSVGASWPAIKIILLEQQLITVSKDDDSGDKVLRGHAAAYRALEKFYHKHEQRTSK